MSLRRSAGTRADCQSNRYTEYRSLYTSLKDLVRTSGVRGLFQGVTATAARDAPYAGMYLVCYEKGKEVACKSGNTFRRYHLVSLADG